MNHLLPSDHKVVNSNKLQFIKEQVCRLWGLPNHFNQNPCPNPVSLERKDLDMLKKEQYMVAEKTDGVRYLLLLTMYPRELSSIGIGSKQNHHQHVYEDETLEPVAIMCNRKYDCYEIQVMAEECMFRNGCLFDGELVWQQINTLSPKRQKLLLFDTINVQGKCMVRKPYAERLSVLHDLFDLPNEKDDIIHNPGKWYERAHELVLKHHKIVCEGNQYALMFGTKLVKNVSQLPYIWEQRQHLLHASDGLILTPNNQPIGINKQMNLFKWKSHHTMDFEWRGTFHNNSTWDHHLFFYDKQNILVRADLYGVLFYYSDNQSNNNIDMYPYQYIPVLLCYTDYMKQILAWHTSKQHTTFCHIIEVDCVLPDKSLWYNDQVPIIECRLLKIRHDKQRPNDRRTIESCLKCMQENISIQELIKIVSIQQNETS